MYPIVLNTEEDLNKFVRENEVMIRGILGDNEELERKQKTIDELTTLKKGIKDGVSSYYIGEFSERVLQERLIEGMEGWEMDDKKRMNAMDIRMKRGGIRLGIECKRKTKVSKGDLDKFKRDKLNNKFDGNIFISTCKIPKVVERSGNCVIIDDNLYIYSDDVREILNYIKVYVETLGECESDADKIVDKEVVNEIFVNHSKQKKSLLEQDKVMVRLMRELGVSTKGFLYMGVQSKYKGGKNPY